MTFLQDRHTSDLAERVAAWLDTPLPADYNRFAIADGTMLDTRAMARLERNATPGMPILENSRYTAYGELGPRLIPIAGLSIDRLKKFLAVADGLPALSFVELHSPAAQPSLQALVWLADTEHTQGVKLYCRYTDTRILPVFLDTLNVEQTTRAAQTLRRWAWVNRQGKLDEKWLIVDAAGDSALSEPLRLDETQFAQLMQGAEPDQIFNLLKEASPEIVPDIAPSELHRRLTELLAAGRKNGVVDAPDQMQFVAIAWSSADTFYQLPCLAPTWEVLRSKATRFSEAIKTWSDAIWEQIDALRSSPNQEPT